MGSVIKRIIDDISRFVGWIAEGVLAAMMLLTAADVLLRYCFRRPILGDYEVTEYMMAVLAPFAIVCCARLKRHVAVEVVVSHYSPRTQAIINSIHWLVTFGLFVIITWQAFSFASFSLSTHITSTVLRIPFFPFTATVGLGLAIFCLVLIVQLVDFVRQGLKK
jgi:TRAP-type C4-dicarboxylate transport system permease small subunit